MTVLCSLDLPCIFRPHKKLESPNTSAALTERNLPESGRFLGFITAVSTTPPTVTIRLSGSGRSLLAKGFSTFGLVAILRYQARGHFQVSFKFNQAANEILVDEVQGFGDAWQKALGEAEQLMIKRGGVEADRARVRW